MEIPDYAVHIHASYDVQCEIQVHSVTELYIIIYTVAYLRKSPPLNPL